MKALNIFKRALNKLVWLARGKPDPMFLEMTWEVSNDVGMPKVPNGYTLRQFMESDNYKYIKLLEKNGMGRFSFAYWEKHILPGGFFIIEDDSSGDIVASCIASHHPTSRHNRAGNLGWLVVDSSHRGKKLGEILCGNVINKLKDAGYTRIYLETQDERVPALRLYLTMGWKPCIYATCMKERWERVFKNLKIEFSGN